MKGRKKEGGGRERGREGVRKREEENDEARGRKRESMYLIM